MQLPKEVTIAGRKYEVIKDNKISGGEGGTGTQRIVVGTKYNKPDSHFTTLVHEIIELSLAERDFRYENVEAGWLFVFNHKEFDVFAADVAAALYPMVSKKKRRKR